MQLKEGDKLKVTHPMRCKGVHKNVGDIIVVGKDIEKDDAHLVVTMDRATADLEWKPAGQKKPKDA